MKKISIILVTLLVGLSCLLSGCGPYEALAEGAYVSGDLYVWDGENWVLINDNLLTPENLFDMIYYGESTYPQEQDTQVEIRVKGEYVQDLLGIWTLEDTDTIDFSYDDPTGKITADFIGTIPVYKAGTSTTSPSTGYDTVTFNTAFSSANYSLQLTAHHGTDEVFAVIYSKTASYFQVVCYDDGGKVENGVDYDWFAIEYIDP